MPKYPHTDLIEAPALHWFNVYEDLLCIESIDSSDDNYPNAVTGYVEDYKRDNGFHHWQLLSSDNKILHSGVASNTDSAKTLLECALDAYISQA